MTGSQGLARARGMVVALEGGRGAPLLAAADAPKWALLHGGLVGLHLTLPPAPTLLNRMSEVSTAYKK